MNNTYRGVNMLYTSCILNSTKTLNCLPLVMKCRHYSNRTIFPSFFQNPIFRKEDQAKMSEMELAKYTAIPVKPPGVSETSSVYHDLLINKVINHIMEMGRKQLARTLLEKSFENIKRTQIERYHLASPEKKVDIILNPKDILHKAVENCKPLLHLLPIKRGGITYQVPAPITDKRALFISIKWLLEAANDKEKPIHFPEQFARELLDAASNTGKVVKRKQDLHRQCEANRAYAHYRWQ